MQSIFWTQNKSHILDVKFIEALVFIFLIYPTICLSDLYYWVDENGIKHYSNIQSGHNSTIAKEIETTSDEIKVDNHFNRPEKQKPNKKANILPTRRPSTPTVDIEYKYYEVIGVNMNDLRTETIKHSPIKQNGKTTLKQIGMNK